MNPNTDHPDLTAFALGEPHADHVAAWMEDMNLRTEVDAISDLALHLQATTPLPASVLHPHQRSAVLTPPERVRQLVAAAKQKEVRKHRAAPILWGTLKWSAAAALVAGSFIAGTQISVIDEGVETAHEQNLPKTKATPITLPALPAKVKAEAPAPLKREAPLPALAQQAVMTKAAPQVAALASAPAPAAPLPQPKVSVVLGSVINTSRQPTASVAFSMDDLLQEASISASSPGLTAASPLRPGAASRGLEPVRREREVDLLIHAWSADVMVSPWDSERRLVRVAIQLPSDQPRRRDFPVEITFDPNAVRNFRKIGQRVLPAADKTHSAQVIAWYEIQPNGQVGTAANSRVLGVAHVTGAKFTTNTAAPFDGSNLRILDRGTLVAEAREDFRFESALIGFGMLIQADPSSQPAASLLLDIAKQSQESSDPTGERAKLVTLLEEAQHMTGME